MTNPKIKAMNQMDC